jgi:hydroxymethylpyrimidine/phosphomethylpyrimidine kinase
MVFAAHGLYGTSVATAITAQSTLGVSAVHPLSGSWIAESLRILAADLPPRGIKIGMLGSAEAVNTVAVFLEELRQKAGNIPVVLDPVLRSSSGRELLESAGVDALRSRLLPLATCITPNWAELAILAGRPVRSLEEAAAAAEALARICPEINIIATAGDCDIPTDLLRTAAGEILEVPGQHIPTTSTHGTGCAFSSALLSRLVLGDSLEVAAGAAKRYIEGALRQAPGLGGGVGPMELLWPLQVKVKL